MKGFISAYPGDDSKNASSEYSEGDHSFTIEGVRPMAMSRQETVPSSGRTVLVVDDNVTNLQIISQCLQKDDCRVLTARDGKSALERMQHGLPDLILLDEMMPEMDGFETCRRLKADGALQKIPIIFMTTLAVLDEKVNIQELCVVDYLTKPLQPEEVLAHVRMQLGLPPASIGHTEEMQGHIPESLTGVNQALKTLLDQREIEKRAIEQTMVVNLKRYVFPYLEELDRLQIDDDVKSYVNIIRTNIEQLISPCSQRLGSAYIDMTSMEIRVADLIRQDKSTKSIAKQLNISPSTVEKHRNKIRKKLNVINRKVNLNTYLKSLC